jgi:hypothetical protein
VIRITTILLLAALGQIMSATAVQAANIQITYLPYTISAPGTYVLTKNMSYPSSQGAAITILKTIPGPVVLDFKGYAITWTGTTGDEAFGVFIGILGPSLVNTYPITIKNGTINGLLLSINGEEAPITKLTVENMSCSNALEAVALAGISFSNINNWVFTLTNYEIYDYNDAANNTYLNNTFNQVGTPITIGNDGLALYTIIVPKVTTLP